MIHITNVDLVNDYVYSKVGLNRSIHFQDIEQKTKFCRQSRAVTLLQICEKTMIHITNVDLVNDYVYSKVGLNRSIRFQDIEQKLNSDVNQGP